MADKIAAVMKNNTPSSKAVYTIMEHRSDGQIMEGKGPKPVTPGDHAVHNGHIIDSGEYNIRHSHDHIDELAFDYQRLNKEVTEKEAQKLKAQTIRILNPVWRKMGLRLEKK